MQKPSARTIALVLSGTLIRTSTAQTDRREPHPWSCQPNATPHQSLPYLTKHSCGYGCANIAYLPLVVFYRSHPQLDLRGSLCITICILCKYFLWSRRIVLSAEQMSWLRLLSEQIAARSVTQSEISSVTGVHQSQISRILAGQLSRASRNVQKLCEYAKTLPKQAPDRSAEELAGALREFLGSATTEEAAIADLLKSLRAWRQRWRSYP